MANKNPLDIFFKMGDKATGGSPVKKALFDYLLYWILFLAFFGLMINYVILFLTNDYQLNFIMWALVMGVISWFNYWALKQFRQVYLNMKTYYSKLEKKPEEKEVIHSPDIKIGDEESVEDMLKKFKK